LDRPWRNKRSPFSYLNNVQKPEPILCGNRIGRASHSVSPPGEFPFSNELFAPNNATAAEP
jgi:hypothetical protein